VGYRDKYNAYQRDEVTKEVGKQCWVLVTERAVVDKSFRLGKRRAIYGMGMGSRKGEAKTCCRAGACMQPPLSGAPVVLAASDTSPPPRASVSIRLLLLQLAAYIRPHAAPLLSFGRLRSPSSISIGRDERLWPRPWTSEPRRRPGPAGAIDESSSRTRCPL
jgi:hypothetical protein